MKVMQVMHLANADYDGMRRGLETFQKHGAGSGMQGLWMSADARTVIGLWEGDDIAEMQKINALYAPFMEGDIETHVVTDVADGVTNFAAGLDMAT